MREIDIGTKTHTKVLDYNGLYFVAENNNVGTPPFACISFQNGPLKTNGLNGCFVEDLIVIAIDKLQKFQEGDTPSIHTEGAIIDLQSALMSLNIRTQDRIDRGVEGTNQQ
jgi:hypothetical protein